MNPRLAGLVIGVGLCSCTSGDPTDATDHTDIVDTDIDTDGPWVRPASGTIVFEMPDGVTVPADYYPASAEGQPAVLLMSCLYRESSRKDWPASVVDHFVENDISVLVPDMRGCGEATGDPRDNRTGLGVLDDRTYVNRLRADGYRNVSVVTGTAMSAAVNAYVYQENGEARRLPASITYLTPNNGDPERLGVRMEQLPVVPSLFLIAGGDAEWGRQVQGLDRADWEFKFYGGSELDLGLFRHHPASVDHLLDFHDRLWSEE